MNKRSLGSVWENIALDYYQKNWYNLLERNYTIRWWELDLIMENKENLVFVEVKVIENIDDLCWYITKNKLNFIKKTIKYFLLDNPTNKEYRVDFVFVKDGKIFEVYENQFI